MFGALALVGAACAVEPGIAPVGTATDLTTTTIAVTTTTEPDVPTPYGDDVIVGIGTREAPRSLNPFLDGSDTGVLDLIAPAVHATGYDIDPDTFELIPDVLEAIPSLDNGGIVQAPDGTLTVTVDIASDAIWSDGTPITASDLQFTYETVIDPDLPIRSDLRDRYDRIVPESLVAEGSRLTFTMEPSIEVELLWDLIIPRHVVEGTDFLADWNDTMWAAGGPFQFSSWEPGQFLELTRNPEYAKTTETGDPLPYLDRVIFRFFEVADTADPRLRQQFSGRDLDVVTIPFALSDAESYREIEGVVVDVAPGMEWGHLNFQFGPGNRNTESRNDNRGYRQAVAQIVDRDGIADELDSVALSAVLPLYVPTLETDPWSRYTVDEVKVAEWLASLAPDAEPPNAVEADTDTEETAPVVQPRSVLTVANDDPSIVTMAGEIVTALSDVGFLAELQLEDAAVFFGTTFDNGTWDLASWRFTAGPGLARAVAFIELFDPDGLPFVGNNFFRWGTVDSTVNNAAVNRYREIVDELATTVDRNRIIELITEAETILADEAVLVPIARTSADGVAYWGDRVLGVQANPAQGVMWNVDVWQRPID